MPTALVTGANRGLGLEFCKQLLEKRYTVIAVCRSASKELTALGVRVESEIDVASKDAPPLLSDRLRGTGLDILVHNAGLLVPDTLETVTREGLIKQFEVNSVAPVMLTQALVSNLGRGSKVGIITSLMGSSADNGSGGYYGYRMSKSAVNIAGVSLARDLQARGVAVALLHPGFVKTDMTGGNGNVEPPESVRGLLARIHELTLETSGRFWHSNGKELPW